MDIHLTSARATAEEQAAVDAELKLHEPGRHALLPVLHAINGSAGWISPGALNYTCVRMNLPPAEVHGVASFYGMFSLTPRQLHVTHVCDDIACLTQGADAICAEMEKKHGPPGTTWLRSPCLGLCEQAPASMITERAADVGPGGAGSPAGEPAFMPASYPAPNTRLLRRIGKVDPTSIEDYRRTGGYEALAKAQSLGPEGIVREVIESRLLGRGGAAFPAGKKWEALLKSRRADSTHYIVCNADESEPGTFKDRVLMEGDPFAILEGLTIGALATGARRGFIYIRGEYPLATQRMAAAITAARAAGLLGDTFDVEIRRGAGAYICGEETALFNSIEGFRGEPRNKPPYPTQSGLFHKPTAVNNVETLVNIPEIILMGGAAYAKIGTAHSTGYKLYCLSGHVKRPGVYEVPFGPTLRDLIEMAGGVAGSGRLQAVLLGGAAGAFVTPAELDTPLTFEGTRAIGATLGSGVVMLFDDTVDLKRILLRIAAFFREETCGQCVPCRIGVVRQEETLHRLVHAQPLGSELDTLREMGQAMRDASICGLGQTASSAIESAIKRWSLFA